MSENAISNSKFGLFLASSSDNVLTNNVMVNNQFNFSVGNWRGDALKESYFRHDIDISNTVDGKPIYYLVDKHDLVIDSSTNAGCVAAISSSNITIKDLTLSNNGWGMLLAFTEDSLVENVTVEDNMVGIVLGFNNNSVITKSTIQNNSSQGISLRSSSGNLIYHNNVLNNGFNAYDDTGTNSWDNGYPNGGNYWSDYVGVDEKSGPNQDKPWRDGIGDTPYDILDFNGNRDHYPFVIEGGWNYLLPIAQINVEPYCVVPLGTDFTFKGTNSYDPDGIIVSYDWDFGDGSDDSGISVTHRYSGVGVYEVVLIVTDNTGLQDADLEMVVVYDPSAGFVTGAGWINSPEGAYTPDPSISGKANFGFVSKYKNGANVPTGQTEFQFHVADLNLHSSSYDWLVVTGSNFAKFKGTGIINGMGSYKFMIWAGDNNPDTFRIKIWGEDEHSVKTVIYDNGINQPIDGGQIVIHSK